VKRLAQLRPIAVIYLAVALVVIVLLTIQGNWLLASIAVLGSLAWAYITRHDARWFR
jgi:hypothetical protein